MFDPFEESVCVQENHDCRPKSYNKGGIHGGHRARQLGEPGPEAEGSFDTQLSRRRRRLLFRRSSESVFHALNPTAVSFPKSFPFKSDPGK